MSRFIFSLAIVVLAALPVSHATSQEYAVAEQSEVLDNEGIIAIAKQKAAIADDKFADDPTPAAIGKRFQITLPQDAVFSDYDRATSRLTVYISGYLDERTLERDVEETQYTGKNAYGASAEIARLRGNTYGVSLARDRAALREGKRFAFSTALPGKEAEQLAKSLQIRITGKVVLSEGAYSQKDGTPVYKRDIISRPTVTKPDDVWIKAYYVAVSVEKAEWIDTRTGGVVDVIEPG